MTRPWRLIAWIAAAALACFGGILAAGWFLARPARQIVGDPPPDLGAEVVTISRVVPGAGHDDYHEVSRTTYEARVRSFLNERLAARVPAR